MQQLQITIPEEALAAFCQRYPIRKLSLFDSVLRADYTPQSDIDVLVEFEPNAGIGYFELAQMQDELSALFGHQVDLLTPAAISKHFRQHVMDTHRSFMKSADQNDHARLLHIREAVEKALAFTEGETRASLDTDQP